MRIFLIFMLIATVVLACGNTSGTPPVDQGPGEKIFQQFCVACHGINGDLALNGAKDLRESRLSKAERVLLITHGRGMMTPFEGLLKPKEIEAVATYTMQRFKKE